MIHLFLGALLIIGLLALRRIDVLLDAFSRKNK
jgi:hypothetical protein